MKEIVLIKMHHKLFERALDMEDLISDTKLTSAVKQATINDFFTT